MSSTRRGTSQRARAAALLHTLAEEGDLERALARLRLDRDAARRLLEAAARLLEEAPEREPQAALFGAPRRPALASAATAEARASSRAHPAAEATRVRVFSDGAARGNPGPAGAGAVIQDTSGEILARLGRFLGRTTNNVAEYEGLLLGLRHALDLGAREVQVVCDSELLVKQLRGQYKVKAEHLKALHAEARALLSRFERYDVRHVLRAENAAADQMANRAIDERLAD